jgi:hypothetical protein
LGLETKGCIVERSYVSEDQSSSFDNFGANIQFISKYCGFFFRIVFIVETKQNMGGKVKNKDNCALVYYYYDKTYFLLSGGSP